MDRLEHANLLSGSKRPVVERFYTNVVNVQGQLRIAHNKLGGIIDAPAITIHPFETGGYALSAIDTEDVVNEMLNEIITICMEAKRRLPSRDNFIRDFYRARLDDESRKPSARRSSRLAAKPRKSYKGM